MRVVSIRARVAAALLAAAVLLAAPASAQDPRASEAQIAARQFLLLTDRDDAKASWEGSGKMFQDAITEPRWAAALGGVRPPLGAVTDRALLSTEFIRKLPGSDKEGDYSIVLFRSSFEKASGALESVTLEREADGVWRVIGYFIR